MIGTLVMLNLVTAVIVKNAFTRAQYDEARRSNDRIIQKFQLLGINEEEREEIWNILDTGDGQINVDGFAEGLRLMQGGAKAKDSFTIVKYVQHINVRLS